MVLQKYFQQMYQCMLIYITTFLYNRISFIDTNVFLNKISKSINISMHVELDYNNIYDYI